ncbi:hypothetical protein BT69DRAFT_1351157 [Atractiella rhizophila]|nr:hypothetical protein BT69DRAFT_1351157 [Atractiella rhizophila]
MDAMRSSSQESTGEDMLKLMAALKSKQQKRVKAKQRAVTADAQDLRVEWLRKFEDAVKDHKTEVAVRTKSFIEKYKSCEKEQQIFSEELERLMSNIQAFLTKELRAVKRIMDQEEQNSVQLLHDIKNIHSAENDIRCNGIPNVTLAPVTQTTDD